MFQRVCRVKSPEVSSLPLNGWKRWRKYTLKTPESSHEMGIRGLSKKEDIMRKKVVLSVLLCFVFIFSTLPVYAHENDAPFDVDILSQVTTSTDGGPVFIFVDDDEAIALMKYFEQFLQSQDYEARNLIPNLISVSVSGVGTTNVSVTFRNLIVLDPIDSLIGHVWGMGTNGLLAAIAPVNETRIWASRTVNLTSVWFPIQAGVIDVMAFDGTGSAHVHMFF